MNKTDLNKAVQDKLACTAKEAAAAVDAVLGAISAGTVKDGEAVITGFGTFKSTLKPAHTGRNPRTGAPMAIEAKHQVTFKAGATFKAAANA